MAAARLDSNGGVEAEGQFNHRLIHRFRAIDYAKHGVSPDFDAAHIRGARTPAGFVMLFDSRLRPIKAANRFLMDHCCAPAKLAKNWRRTQAAYADDLAQWWTYLAVNEIAWDAALPTDLDDYARGLATGVSTTTHRRYAASTIARRIGTVETFYDSRTAAELGAASLSDAGGRRRAVSTELATVSQTGGIEVKQSERRPKSSPADEKVNPIATPQLKLILNRLGTSPYVKDANDERPIRDRLIVEASLYTGMRVEEVTSLTLYQILDVAGLVDPADPWKPIPLRLVVTKGGDSRVVLPPSRLVKAMLDYADSERADIVAQCKASNALFLNGLRSNARDRGQPTRPATASRLFNRAVLHCGLTRTQLSYVIDEETGAPKLSDNGDEILIPRNVAKYSFHDLRHTFACNYYASHVNTGHPPPWKRLQALLGHKSLKTTMDIYLRHVDGKEPYISDMLGKYLNEKLNELL